MELFFCSNYRPAFKLLRVHSTIFLQKSLLSYCTFLEESRKCFNLDDEESKWDFREIRTSLKGEEGSFEYIRDGGVWQLRLPREVWCFNKLLVAVLRIHACAY